MNAAFIVPLVGITLMALGLAGVGAAAWRSHKASSRLDFIRSLGADAEMYAQQVAPALDRVQDPLVNRIFGPVANGLRRNLSRLYPASEIDSVHADLLKAGLTGTVRAEEFVAVQVGLVLLGIAVGLVSLVSVFVSAKIGFAILLLLPIIGGLVPTVPAPPEDQDAVRARDQRLARPARPHDDLGGRGPGTGAGHAGVLRGLVRVAGVRRAAPDAPGDGARALEARRAREHEATHRHRRSGDVLGRALPGRRARPADRPRPGGAGRRDARQAAPASAARRPPRCR